MFFLYLPVLLLTQVQMKYTSYGFDTYGFDTCIYIYDDARAYAHTVAHNLHTTICFLMLIHHTRGNKLFSLHFEEKKQIPLNMVRFLMVK